MGNACYQEVYIEEDKQVSMQIDKDRSSKTNSTGVSLEQKDLIEHHQIKNEINVSVLSCLCNPPQSKYTTQQLDFESSGMQDTVALIKYQTCYRCQQDIENMTIQLKCFHVFHEECLIELLKEQLERKNSVLYCQCEQKISAKILILLKTPEQYLNRLHKLQLIEIANKYKLIKCEKCKFIYYNKDNTPCQCF